MFSYVYDLSINEYIFKNYLNLVILKEKKITPNWLKKPPRSVRFI